MGREVEAREGGLESTIIFDIDKSGEREKRRSRRSGGPEPCDAGNVNESLSKYLYVYIIIADHIWFTLLLQMIFSLPNPSVLSLLLVAIVACVASSLAPLAEGLPLTVSDETLDGTHSHCSTNLDEAIRFVCKGRTQSLADLYRKWKSINFSICNADCYLSSSSAANSFGQVRTKRLIPDEIFYKPLSRPTHLCCLQPCGYNEIRQYCADT